jgi:Ca2+-binding EF-hand superfamily protein
VITDSNPLNLLISDLRTAFDLLDRDQDGMVTPTELQFMLRNLGIDVSDELIDALMKEASKTGKSAVHINVIHAVSVTEMITKKKMSFSI